MRLLSIIKNNKGVELIMTILLMTLILFLAIYLLDAALTESRIAKSQSWGAKTYYLAEAGIQDMVWKLKNDATYKQNFQTVADWTASFTRTDPFGSGSGSYAVSIANTSPAHAEITASSSIGLGSGVSSQRIIQTDVYQALGNTALGDITGYGDHDLNISNSRVNVYDGSLYVNHDLEVSGSSLISIDKDLNAVHDYTKDFTATVTVKGVIHSPDNPPAPAEVDVPAVDFDSKQSTSYKNKADIVYNDKDFANLIKNNQTLTLNNDITYIDNDVTLDGGHTLIINGLLVVGHDFTIGNSTSGGYANITVNNTPGKPSGILVKHKITFSKWTGNVTVNGLIYASQDLTLDSLPVGYVFNVNGDMISGHDLTISGTWRPVNITKNDETSVGVLGPTTFSPIIMVKHWEEEY